MLLLPLKFTSTRPVKPGADMKKIFVTEVLLNEISGDSDPNFIYVEVTPKLESIINKRNHFLADIAEEIGAADPQNKLFDYREGVTFTLDYEDPELAPKTEGLDILRCHTMLTKDGLWHDILATDKSDFTETGVISFSDIADYESKVQKIPLTYVSSWDDGTKELKSKCTMNSFSGELDIEVGGDHNDNGTLDREYVMDDEGNEYLVFRNDAINGGMFVTPSAFFNLKIALKEKETENSGPAM